MIASTARIIAARTSFLKLGLGRRAYRAAAADSGSIAISGNSSSVPQRVHNASCSLTILPQPGHCLRSSSRSVR